MNRLPRVIVVMGVSGSGKSLIGRMLAVKLNAACAAFPMFVRCLGTAAVNLYSPLLRHLHLRFLQIHLGVRRQASLVGVLG